MVKKKKVPPFFGIHPLQLENCNHNQGEEPDGVWKTTLHNWKPTAKLHKVNKHNRSMLCEDVITIIQ